MAASFPYRKSESPQVLALAYAFVAVFVLSGSLLLQPHPTPVVDEAIQQLRHEATQALAPAAGVPLSTPDSFVPSLSLAGLTASFSSHITASPFYPYSTNAPAPFTYPGVKRIILYSCLQLGDMPFPPFVFEA